MEFVYTLKDFSREVDGEWRLDLSTLNNYELYLYKEIAGILPLNLGEAMMGGDIGVTVAHVTIALLRAGVGNVQLLAKKPDGILWQAKPGQIFLDVDTGDDAVPPPNGSSGDSSDGSGSSTPSSVKGSDATQEKSTRTSSGQARSDTGAT